MFIGFLVALVLFAPLSYAVTRGVVRYSQQSNSPYWGVLYLFLAQLMALSLLGFALLAIASVLGFSASIAADAALSTMATNAQPGVVTALGALVVGIWGFIGILTGPACAFLAAKIVAIVALVGTLARADEDLVSTWIPVFAAGTALFTMWPFTAYLTFGL